MGFSWKIRTKEKHCQQRQSMKAHEEGRPTNGQLSTPQSHRFPAPERSHRITWPNPLTWHMKTPNPRGSVMWPRSLSRSPDRIPRHPTPRSALGYSSFPSFNSSRVFMRKNKERTKLHSASFVLPQPLTERQTGWMVDSGLQEAQGPPCAPHWDAAHKLHGKVCAQQQVSAQGEPLSLQTHDDILLPWWAFQPSTEQMPDQSQLPSRHRRWQPRRRGT